LPRGKKLPFSRKLASDSQNFRFDSEFREIGKFGELGGSRSQKKPENFLDSQNFGVFEEKSKKLASKYLQENQELEKKLEEELSGEKPIQAPSKIKMSIDEKK